MWLCFARPASVLRTFKRIPEGILARCNLCHKCWHRASHLSHVYLERHLEQCQFRRVYGSDNSLPSQCVQLRMGKSGLQVHLSWRGPRILWQETNTLSWVSVLHMPAQAQETVVHGPHGNSGQCLPGCAHGEVFTRQACFYTYTQSHSISSSRQEALVVGNGPWSWRYQQGGSDSIRSSFLRAKIQSTEQLFESCLSDRK